jgi:FSR family fosmidomycin resistance protein-like MFS transporter
MAVGQASFLRERNYWAVSITHFFVDVLNSGRTLLVALLAVNLGLSNAQVGIALLLYNVGNSLTQPLFGLLADRIGPRWLVVGGMGWMIAFYGIAALSGDWPALVALTIAGIGSGAFHPTGTMVASKISLTHRTRATAIFFMAGQFGLFSGPILAGLLLDQYGRPGYLALPAASVLAFAGGWRWLVDRTNHRSRDAVVSAAVASAPKPPPDVIRRAVLLAIIISSGATVSIAANNFAPKLFTELGKSPGYVGLLGGVLMMGSAFGGVLGGSLADRFGGRPVILVAVLATMLPIYFYIPVEGPGRFALLMLAGFFGGMPHSILIIRAQSLVPGRRALASGLALGFMFFSGSVGSTIIGVVADNVGLAQTLQSTAFLPILAATATLLLPREAANTGG